MFHVAPLGVALIVCLVCTAISLVCSASIYTSERNIVSLVDVGFEHLPNLAAAAGWLPPAFALVHALASISFFAFHEHRVTVLRRMLLLFGLSELLQQLQNLVTRFPNPNPEYLLQRGGYYMGYSTQFTLISLVVEFYVSPLMWRAVWWAFFVLGQCLVISCRVAYTVDVLCSLAPPILLFLLYHWYCRDEVAILKRGIVYWFERDVFFVLAASPSEKGPTFVFQSPHSLQSNGPSFDNNVSLIRRLDEWVYDEYRLLSPRWNAFRLERGDSKYSIYSEGTTFAVTDGRGPSDATLQVEHTVPTRLQAMISSSSHAAVSLDTAQVRVLDTIKEDPGVRVVAELIDRADMLTNDEKVRRPRLAAIVCTLFGVTIAVSNLISVHIGDMNRPLGLPHPFDVLHNALPVTLPPHAADLFLYPVIGGCLIFAVRSRFTWVIIHRIGICYGFSMLFRMVTMIVTYPPDPSAACTAREHPAGVTCGDLIYSGHTIAFLMCTFSIRYFTREKLWAALAWCLSAGGLTCVIVSRLHYTRDVVTSLIVISIVNHVCRVVLFKRVSFVRDNKFAWWIESGYYISLADERHQLRELVRTGEPESVMVDIRTAEVRSATPTCACFSGARSDSAERGQCDEMTGDDRELATTLSTVSNGRGSVSTTPSTAIHRRTPQVVSQVTAITDM